MQINNIAITADKCRKPCRTFNFGSSESEIQSRKVRYKHYEELGNDELIRRSISKAYQKAQKSPKAALYKAIPAIATGIITTSLALTRPGKLSSKIATGLGFLATMKGIDAIFDIAASNDKNKRKKNYGILGAIATAAAGALLFAKGAGKTNKIYNFIAKEAFQLKNEINSTKLADFSDKVIEPFIQKHENVANAAPLTTAIFTSLAGLGARNIVSKSISKDIKKDATNTFEHAKQIQQVARNHFDSIDAVEV